MSSLTICNYCSLNQIKCRAKREKMQVTLRSGWGGGTDVFVHPKGVEPDRDEHFAAWLMELTSFCCC